MSRVSHSYLLTKTFFILFGTDATNSTMENEIGYN